VEDRVENTRNPLRFAGAPNFRDFGGARTRDGRAVVLGRFFRSQVLSELSDEDLPLLEALGIHAVCDLRSSEEQARHSNRWPENLTPFMVRAEGGLESSHVRPAEWLARLRENGYRPEDARRQMDKVYRSLARSFRDHVAALFAYLDRPDAGPVLIHCTAGNDRTGFVCATILFALGVPRDAILADYLESAKWFSLATMGKRLEKYLGGPIDSAGIPALNVLVGVEEGFLAAAFDQVRTDHGTVEKWLREVVGLDDAMRDRLRQRYTV
jgi:protein-tyrosine phosphatase